ncbi:DNA oxidative demethylase AlkB [Undibacterium jejuense]|uniref:DNA oxidative demethylase AlkB n=1 Tax=Undibacterium jejuense TaxID=1344949 RepID=UPI0031B5D290
MNYLLFDEQLDTHWTETLFPGAVILRRYAVERADTLISELDAILRQAPLRQMKTPGGRTIAVQNSSCGEFGWISDTHGYRYIRFDPISKAPWPAMPQGFKDLAIDAARAAGFDKFIPDSCLINRYLPGTKLSLHQDKDELDFNHPIVSVSLGMPAIFVFGGLQRSDPLSSIKLEHGDVLVWGGPARLLFHGVKSVKDQPHGTLGSQRINLTFRRAK